MWKLKTNMQIWDNSGKRRTRNQSRLFLFWHVKYKLKSTPICVRHAVMWNKTVSVVGKRMLLVRMMFSMKEYLSIWHVCSLFHASAEIIIECNTFTKHSENVSISFNWTNPSFRLLDCWMLQQLWCCYCVNLATERASEW
jgi:hypothetical protein